MDGTVVKAAFCWGCKTPPHSVAKACAIFRLLNIALTISLQLRHTTTRALKAASSKPALLKAGLGTLYQTLALSPACWLCLCTMQVSSAIKWPFCCLGVGH